MKKLFTKQPFKGEPKTRLSYDRKGNPRFDVAIQELTPFRAKAADTTATLTSWSILGLAVSQAANMPGADWKVWLAAIALPFALQPAFKWVTRAQFKKTTRILFTKNEFLVNGWLKSKSFHRQLNHSFQLLAHDDVKKEHERLQLQAMKARQRGKLIIPTQYYGESFHLVFGFLGERFDIATIYGEFEAKRALDRLNAIDSVIDALTNVGMGMPLRPDNQWNPQPGDLPE